MGTFSVIPTFPFRCVTATLLSAALHGGVVWAVGRIQHRPSMRSPRRHPPIELFSLVEIAEPASLPPTIPSQPGTETTVEDSSEVLTPSQTSPAPEDLDPPSPQAEPEPNPTPSLAQPRRDKPLAEPVKPTPSQPAAVHPPLPASVELKPFHSTRHLFPLPPTLRSPSRPTKAAASQPASGRGSVGKANAKRANDRNPILLTALHRLLRQNYPNQAREAGIEGYAKLELVVTRRGRPESIRILGSHGHPDFGEACLRTVKRSRWRPAKDREGRRIAVRVRYRCRFSID